MPPTTGSTRSGVLIPNLSISVPRDVKNTCKIKLASSKNSTIWHWYLSISSIFRRFCAYSKSAANKNLKEEVKNKNFREDLYYRLNVIPITIPPLRERKNDIPLLVDHFLKQAEEDYKQKPPRISKEAMSLMMDYAWPGNVRELQNSIQFAIVKCSGSLIIPNELPVELRENNKAGLKRGPSKKLDFNTIKSALEQTGGNKSRAAKLLGVGRATLYRFLGEHPELLKHYRASS
jgi:DNA-binding NtrC family response regulator